MEANTIYCRIARYPPGSYRVTIPAELIKSLNLQKGDIVKISIEPAIRVNGPNWAVPLSQYLGRDLIGLRAVLGPSQAD